MARDRGISQDSRRPGKWYARVNYRGRRYKRAAANKTHARELYATMKADIAKGTFMPPNAVRLVERAPEGRLEGGPRLYSFYGKRPPTTEGVYFLQHLATGAVKIGYASNVFARIGDLLVAVPGACLYLGTIEGGMSVEREIHAKCAQWRETGEWFRSDDGFVEHLIRLGLDVLSEVRVERTRLRFNRLNTPEGIAKALERLNNYRKERAKLASETAEN